MAPTLPTTAVTARFLRKIIATAAATVPLLPTVAATALLHPTAVTAAGVATLSLTCSWQSLSTPPLIGETKTSSLQSKIKEAVVLAGPSLQQVPFEALYAINKSSLLSFSEQQLIDCTKTSTYGNDGCSGGLMVPSFQYTAANGIELESDYPFTGKDGNCQYSASKVAFKNTGYISVPANNYTLLKHAANLQPVTVAIEADQSVFQNYQSGIISSNCGTNLDHAVLVVGYNTSNGQDYWIVKNQWGTSWGVSGICVHCSWISEFRCRSMWYQTLNQPTQPSKKNFQPR